MDDVDDGDDNDYNHEVIETIIIEAIDSVLADKIYDESKVHQWINDI